MVGLQLDINKYPLPYSLGPRRIILKRLINS